MKCIACLSHGAEEGAFASRLASDLRLRGLTVRLDRWHVQPDGLPTRALREVAKGCRVLLLVPFGMKAASSDEARMPAARSADGGEWGAERVILLTRAGGEVPTALRSAERIDFRENASYDVALAALVDLLEDAAGVAKGERQRSVVGHAFRAAGIWAIAAFCMVWFYGENFLVSPLHSVWASAISAGVVYGGVSKSWRAWIIGSAVLLVGVATELIAFGLDAAMLSFSAGFMIPFAITALLVTMGRGPTPSAWGRALWAGLIGLAVHPLAVAIGWAACLGIGQCDLP